MGIKGMMAWGCLLCGTGFAQETVLVDNPAMPDELVADQSTAAPTRIPVSFTSFRYPHLDQDQSVTFIADDPFYRGGQKFGIYRSEGKTGKVVKLVCNEDSPPGRTALFQDFLGLQVEGKKYAFRGIFPGGEGVYGDFGDGLRLIADTSTPAPSTSGSFRAFAYADVSGDLAIFVAEDPGGIYGLYSYDARSRKIRRLVDEKTVLPDGSSIRTFNGQPWMDSGSIVFRGSDAAGRHAIFRIARDSLDKPQPPPIEILLDHSTPLPTALTIKTLTSAPVEGGVVAFVASGLDANGKAYTGIFILQDGKVKLAVDNHTEIPEENLRFTHFQKWIALQSGMVVFRGGGVGGYEGIFAFDTASGELHPLLDNRTLIDGRKPKSFEIASNPVVGSRIAFLAVFDGEQDAIFLASVKNGPLKSISSPTEAPSAPQPLH